jgi:hypothetical protein
VESGEGDSEVLAAGELVPEAVLVIPEDDVEAVDVAPPDELPPEQAVASAATISRATGPVVVRDLAQPQAPRDGRALLAVTVPPT